MRCGPGRAGWPQDGTGWGIVVRGRRGGGRASAREAGRASMASGGSPNAARRQLGTRVAPPGHRRTEHLRKGNGQHAGGGERTVVDVLAQRERLRGMPPHSAHEADRIDLQQQRRGAPFGARLRVEHMCGAGRDPELLYPTRMLVEQVAQVGSGSIRRRQRQEHDPHPPRLRPCCRPGSGRLVAACRNPTGLVPGGEGRAPGNGTLPASAAAAGAAASFADEAAPCRAHLRTAGEAERRIGRRALDRFE